MSGGYRTHDRCPMAPRGCGRRSRRPQGVGSSGVKCIPRHSIWAQDAYCVLNDEQGVCTMLEPLAFTRYGDHFIAEQLSANTDIQIATTKYYIEGGNVLCGDNYALIGKDFLHASVEVSGESENEVTEGLKKELGVEQLIWVGFDDAVDFPLSIHQGKYQPIFHIDMFMTLAGKSLQGKELILVGDTRQAKSLLDQPPIPEVISDSFDPGFPFWPSWSVYDSRLPAAMQRFSHCCQVRYSFRCRSGLRMLADHGVPAKPEGPLATPLPRRPSATRVRWLFRAVDVTLRAQVAPKSAAACRRTTSGSDAPPQAATNNIARASRAVRPSSSADAASSSATSF